MTGTMKGDLRAAAPALSLVALMSIAVAVHAETPPSEQWMVHCARNLAPEQLPKEVVRKYCACMADVGEEAEMLAWSQTELERSYPPAHVQCHEAARRG